MWLAPALLVAPVLLSFELLSFCRTGARMSRVFMEQLASTWSGIAAMLILVIAAGPLTWAQVHVRAVELHFVALSVVLAAGSAALSAATRRHWSSSIRFVIISTAAAFAGLWTSAVENSFSRIWPIFIAVLVILFALAIPVGAMGTAAAAAKMWAGHGVRITRSAVGRIQRAVVRAARACIGFWHRLEIFASSPQPRARPMLTRSDRIGATVMAFLAMAYVANGAIWSYRIGWQPTAHAATIMARAFDVGTVNHPLVGMATSLGQVGSASHPGPLSMDLLAPFVRLFGVQNGARAAAVFVVLTCWTVSVWSAWRAAGRVAALGAWMMCAVILQVAAFGAVWEANNVTITILAIFAAVLASWAAATGTWRAWWWAVGLGSLCAQSYLPHALIVLGPILWAGLAVAGAARLATDTHQARRARQAVRVGWGIALLAWAQPALDVVINNGGNVRALIGEISSPRPPVGPIGFPRAIAWICSIPPRWGEVTRSFAQAGSANELIRGPFISGTIVALALCFICVRTRKTTPPHERQLRIIILLLVVGAAVNTTQLPQDYLRAFQIGWLVVASACLWYAVGISTVFAVQRKLGSVVSDWVSLSLKVSALAIGALVILAAGLARPERIEDAKSPAFTIDAMVEPAVDQTMEKVDSSNPILVLSLDNQLVESATDTIVSNLIVKGLDSRTESRGEHYGERRVVKHWRGPMLWVASGLAPVKPNGELLAAVSMPGWSRVKFDALAEKVSSDAKAGSGVRLQPWVEELLPRYLAGWMGPESCRIAKGIVDGTYPVESLPPGLLLTLYGDQAIASPALPPETQEEASALLGQAPLEVWSVNQKTETATDTATLLRDGSRCPAA